jgi:hypothetical protein
MNWSKNLNSNTSQGRIHEFFKVEFYYWVWFSKGEGGGTIISGFQKGESLFISAISTLFWQNVLEVPTLLICYFIDIVQSIIRWLENDKNSLIYFPCLNWNSAVLPHFTNLQVLKSNFISVVHDSSLEQFSQCCKVIPWGQLSFRNCYCPRKKWYKLRSKNSFSFKSKMWYKKKWNRWMS